MNPGHQGSRDVAPGIVVRDTTSRVRCNEVCDGVAALSNCSVELRRIDLQMLKRARLRPDAAPFHVVIAERSSASQIGTLHAEVDDVLFVEDANWLQELEHSVQTLIAAELRLRQIEDQGRLVGRSLTMCKLRKELAYACVAADTSVLVTGETGTGKRVVAEVLHAADPLRSLHPFHSLDCGAVTPGLLGSELFGHVRGSFTGANVSRAGALQTAGRGTLLLDELGELDITLQPALLAALQQRSFRSVGSDCEQPVQCRVVSATNRDLEGMVSQARFREDLLHRVAQITVHLPPLRERRDDLPELCSNILTRWRPDAAPKVTADVAERLTQWPFRGNVRELESILRHALLRAGTAGQIRISHLPEALRCAEPPAAPGASPEQDPPASLDVRMARVRREIVEQALHDATRSLGAVDRTAQVAHAARALQISPRSLYNYLSD